MQQLETDERWYVQFDSGEVQLMTLEELDAAFDAGEVHENTFVIQVGETEWQTLADVAGLSDEEEAVEPEAEADPETTTLYTPAQAASMHAAAQVAPALRAPAAPAPAVSPAVAAYQNARPAAAAAAGGWPPVAAPAAPQSTWPPAAMNRPSGGYNLGPQSTIPVVNDLDMDFETPRFNSGRRSALIAVFAAIPVLGGGGYALTRMDTAPELPPVAAAAPVHATSPWVPPPSSPTPVAAPTPPPEAKSDSGSTGRLSDDMKKALLASDSGRSPKAKAKSSAPARSSTASSKKGGGSVFKAGGSTNDPLNSKL